MTTSTPFPEQTTIKDSDKLVLRDGTTTKIVLRENLVAMPYGSFTMDGNSTETTIAVAGTYTKILGTSINGTASLVTLSNGRITYTGLDDRHFVITAAISMTAGGNNKVGAFKIAKNGTVFGNSIRRSLGAGLDVGALAVQADVILSTNDYIELFVTCLTDTTGITAENLHFSAVGHA